MEVYGRYKSQAITGRYKRARNNNYKRMRKEEKNKFKRKHWGKENKHPKISMNFF